MDDKNECPLCMDPLELDDISFYPCDCGYQICRFCWTRIINEENGLCPACRQTYNTEKPAFFKPISNEELYRMKKEKKKREQLKKGKSLAESRKHLADLRVVQTNLIFVVGIPIRLSMDVNLLSSSEYFGRYGKIFKLVVNHNNTFVGPQGQQCVSAYVTYKRKLDAMRALLDLNKRQFDSRQLKVSLGTTKYCSQFLKGVLCSKAECMYLHELGEEEASFTKEEMQQGKHTEYEQKLIAEFIVTNPEQQQQQLDEADRIDWEPKQHIDSGAIKLRHDSCSAANKLSAKNDLSLDDFQDQSEKERKRVVSLNMSHNTRSVDSQLSPFDAVLSVDTNSSACHPVMNCWASSGSMPADTGNNSLSHIPNFTHLAAASSNPSSQEGGLPSTHEQNGHQAAGSFADIDEEHAATYDFDPFRESQEGLAELIEKERTMYNLMLQQQQMNNNDSLQNFTLSQVNRSDATNTLPNHFFNNHHSSGQSTSSFMFSNSNVSSSYPPAHNNYINSRGFSPADQTAAHSYNSQYLNRLTKPGSLFSGYSLSDQSSSSYSSDSHNFSQYAVNNQFQSSAILDFPNSIKHSEDLNMQEFHDALRSILPHANISIKSPSSNFQQDFFNMSSSQQPFPHNDFPNSAGRFNSLSSSSLPPTHFSKDSSSWLIDDPAIVGGSGVTRSSSMQDNFGVPLVNLSTNQKIPSPNNINPHSNWNGYSEYPASNQFSQKFMQQQQQQGGGSGVNNNNNSLWTGYHNYLDSNSSSFNSVFGPSPQSNLGSNYRGSVPPSHSGGGAFPSSTMYQNHRVISQSSYSPNFPL